MKEGETVSQGLSSQMVIVSVADLSSMRIELLVDETDIGEVAVGQGVEFTVDAYPNKTFHGVVTDISKSSIPHPALPPAPPALSYIIRFMLESIRTNWMGSTPL